MRHLLIFVAIVLACPADGKADYTIFNLEPHFQDAVAAGNQQHLYTETFSNSNLELGDETLLPLETLEFGQPLIHPETQLGFPDGLSNDLITVSAIGELEGAGWAALFNGFSEMELLFGRGIDINVIESGVTALGLYFKEFFPLGDLYAIEVFDNEGNSVFSIDDFVSTNFVGIVADEGDSIGRLRIETTLTDAVSPFIADDIQIWQTQSIPEPSWTSIAALSALMYLRRRRKHHCIPEKNLMQF